MDPHPWGVALGDYVTAARASGRSPATIRLHRHYLSRLADDTDHPWTVTTGDLLRFLSVEHWKPETRRSARSTVRSFYRWGHGSGHIEDDPALALPTVRVPPGEPRPTPEGIVAMLVRGSDERVAFMAMLGAYAGLRAGEIARVHGRDLVGDSLSVLGKGGRTRSVPIMNVGLYERLVSVGDAWAFPNRQGGHFTSGHVSKLLSKAMPEGWTAHTLRHRMGTRAYAGTRDLLAVQQLLGHSRPETTQRYVLVPDDFRRLAVAATELAS